MKISILTICPESFESFLKSHVVRRAAEKKLASVEIIDIRDYAGGSFRHIDDSPYGGGRGMLLRCQPVFSALAACGGEQEGRIVAALSPAGAVYRQETARRYADASQLVLICGHYEGLDERIIERADEVISIGDYVLTGGELAAMTVADSVLRLLKGNLRQGSAEEESFEDGLLEYPQYTQPAEVEGACVPKVLLSGNHEAIRQWRKQEALRITAERRPDLLRKRAMTAEGWEILERLGYREQPVAKR